jgi:hypothetical protein
MPRTGETCGRPGDRHHRKIRTAHRARDLGCQEFGTIVRAGRVAHHGAPLVLLRTRLGPSERPFDRPVHFDHRQVRRRPSADHRPSNPRAVAQVEPRSGVDSLGGIMPVISQRRRRGDQVMVVDGECGRRYDPTVAGTGHHGGDGWTGGGDQPARIKRAGRFSAHLRQRCPRRTQPLAAGRIDNNRSAVRGSGRGRGGAGRGGGGDRRCAPSTGGGPAATRKSHGNHCCRRQPGGDQWLHAVGSANAHDGGDLPVNRPSHSSVPASRPQQVDPRHQPAMGNSVRPVDAEGTP